MLTSFALTSASFKSTLIFGLFLPEKLVYAAGFVFALDYGVESERSLDMPIPTFALLRETPEEPTRTASSFLMFC